VWLCGAHLLLLHVTLRLSLSKAQPLHSPPSLYIEQYFSPLRSRGHPSRLPAYCPFSRSFRLPLFLRLGSVVSAMRLLYFNSSRRLSFADFSRKTIPPYAILSHTWGDDEFLFKDLVNGTSESKAGYKKIKFCSEQAARDSLQYF
jgi:hypothetical protein